MAMKVSKFWMIGSENCQKILKIKLVLHFLSYYLCACRANEIVWDSWVEKVLMI